MKLKGISEEKGIDKSSQYNLQNNCNIVNEEEEVDNSPQPHLDDDLGTATINSQLFTIIDQQQIKPDLEKTEMVDDISKNYQRDPLQDNLFTCNMAQTNLDNQVLSMMEKQPWEEAPKEKNGNKRKKLQVQCLQFTQPWQTRLYEARGDTYKQSKIYMHALQAHNKNKKQYEGSLSGAQRN